MPVTVRCPQCSKELVAPDELIGKIAACPHCNITFPLAGNSRKGAPVPPVPPARSVPPNSTASQSSIAVATISTNLPPSSGTSGQHPVPPPPPETRGTATPMVSAAAARQEPAGSHPVAIPVNAAGANGNTSSLSLSRTPNRARFITANPTERRIALGADGRLPELHLEEAGKTEAVPKGARSSNPLVLIGVLTVSFGMSAMMLFMDTETRLSESEIRSAAREELTLHYTQSHRRLEPYQEELRRALQLHNQGKYADERACYRRVLDLLHGEHHENLKGLTGVRRGLSPPSDEHLESLLSKLLSDD